MLLLTSCIFLFDCCKNGNKQREIDKAKVENVTDIKEVVIAPLNSTLENIVKDFIKWGDEKYGGGRSIWAT